MKARSPMAFLPAAISLSLFLFVSSSSVSAQGASSQRPQAPKISQEACDPPLSPVVFGSKADAEISQRMKELFDVDQSSRRGIMSHKELWPKLEKEDQARRVEVMGYLRDGKLAAADDYYYAAMIFQHGNCAEHYKLSNQLAEKSMGMGNHDARWLYAASLDRYLMTLGKPQKFGTQYVKDDKNGKWELYSVDAATTDAERARYDVPPLAETQKQLERMNQKSPQ